MKKKCLGESGTICFDDSSTWVAMNCSDPSRLVDLNWLTHIFLCIVHLASLILCIMYFQKGDSDQANEPVLLRDSISPSALAFFNATRSKYGSFTFCIVTVFKILKSVYKVWNKEWNPQKLTLKWFGDFDQCYLWHSYPPKKSGYRLKS